MFGFKKNPKEPESVEFLKFCERNFGAEPSSIHVLPPSNPSLSKISTFIWHDSPEPGIITVVSYGLSLMRKPDWVRGRPELMLRLETTDKAWGFAVAAFIDMFREEKNFAYQTILTTDDPIVPGSEMRGFFTFGPPVAKPEVASFASSEGLPINLVGFYPIYIEERELLPKVGLDAFWHHEQFDFLNPNRPNLAKIMAA